MSDTHVGGYAGKRGTRDMQERIGKLRRRVSELEDLHAKDKAENGRLRAENAKLRELAGYMLRCMLENHDCSDCLINGEHCEISYIEEDLRELGIEVD